MKHSVFLILSAMAIVFSSCTGSNYPLHTAADIGNAMINSNHPSPLKSDPNCGVYLPISKRSALNIDVECIIDYAQGESTAASRDDRYVTMSPWFRLIISY